jgi:hypothetical protein
MFHHFNLWIWDRKVVGAIFWLFVIAPLLVTAAQYPWESVLEFGGLLVSAVGLLFHTVYKFIGRRVERLMLKARRDGGRPIPSLIWNDLLQSPGVIYIEGGRLHGSKIVGAGFVLDRADIQSYEEGRWFNGSLLFGKRGFKLKTRAHEIVGVAVPAAAAATLRGFLEN